MGANGPETIVKLVMDAATEEGVSVHQIVCRTGLDHRTVKKYVDLIIEIQAAQKLAKAQEGLRTLVKLSQ